MQMLVQLKSIVDTDLAGKSNQLASRHASTQIARTILDQCQAYVRRPVVNPSCRRCRCGRVRTAANNELSNGAMNRTALPLTGGACPLRRGFRGCCSRVGLLITCRMEIELTAPDAHSACRKGRGQ